MLQILYSILPPLFELRFQSFFQFTVCGVGTFHLSGIILAGILPKVIGTMFLHFR